MNDLSFAGTNIVVLLGCLYLSLDSMLDKATEGAYFTSFRRSFHACIFDGKRS